MFTACFFNGGREMEQILRNKIGLVFSWLASIYSKYNIQSVISYFNSLRHWFILQTKMGEVAPALLNRKTLI